MASRAQRANWSNVSVELSLTLDWGSRRGGSVAKLIYFRAGLGGQTTVRQASYGPVVTVDLGSSSIET